MAVLREASVTAERRAGLDGRFVRRQLSALAMRGARTGSRDLAAACFGAHRWLAAQRCSARGRVRAPNAIGCGRCGGLALLGAAAVWLLTRRSRRCRRICRRCRRSISSGSGRFRIWPWLPDRWPLLLAGAGPLRWIIAALAVAGIVARVLADPRPVTTIAWPVTHESRSSRRSCSTLALRCARIRRLAWAGTTPLSGHHPQSDCRRRPSDREQPRARRLPGVLRRRLCDRITCSAESMGRSIRFTPRASPSC